MKKNIMIYKDSYKGQVSVISEIHIIVLVAGIFFATPYLISLSTANAEGIEQYTSLAIVGVILMAYAGIRLLYLLLFILSDRRLREKVIKEGIKVEGKIIKYRKAKPIGDLLHQELENDKYLKKNYGAGSKYHYNYLDEPYTYQLEFEYKDPDTLEMVKETTTEIIGNPEVNLASDYCDIYLYKGEAYIPNLELIPIAIEEVDKETKDEGKKIEAVITNGYITQYGQIIKLKYEDPKDKSEKTLKVYSSIRPERLKNNKCTIYLYKNNVYITGYKFAKAEEKEIENQIIIANYDKDKSLLFLDVSPTLFKVIIIVNVLIAALVILILIKY